MNSLNSGRPLFANPLDEPAFYRRYFARWVEEGMEEARLTAEILDSVKKNVAGT